MSYCRFSSDNWKSDVYIFDDVDGGVTIHVASNRIKNHDDLIQVPPFPDTDDKKIVELWFEMHNKQSKQLKTVERERIESPYSGESYRCIEYEDAIELLEKMSVNNINVPDGVIEALKEEARASA